MRPHNRPARSGQHGFPPPDRRHHPPGSSPDGQEPVDLPFHIDRPIPSSTAAKGSRPHSRKARQCRQGGLFCLFFPVSTERQGPRACRVGRDLAGFGQGVRSGGGQSARQVGGVPLTCVAAGCRPDGTVLDIFAADATTGIAARHLDRSFIGVERSADLCRAAERRLREGSGHSDGDTR
ncbi:DNA methyltransferase [Actinomadura syzygii]|uniref:DNA methyltransferase n=1 Tax=Actinomadura syzygii TaxID=1427538 RepID=UPI003CCC4A11